MMYPRRDSWEGRTLPPALLIYGPRDLSRNVFNKAVSTHLGEFEGLGSIIFRGCTPKIFFGVAPPNLESRMLESWVHL